MSVVAGSWTGLVGAAGAGLVGLATLAGYRRWTLQTNSMKWNGQDSVRLEGKTAVVTGANTGIGYEVAKDFAARGAKVILCCRDTTKGEEAKKTIVTESGNDKVLVKKIDFASLKSVREFAKDILATEEKIDILVNNAGAAGLGNVKSEDGLQLGLQVNHFGAFLLTNLLLGKLKESAPSRIVMVSAMGHKWAKIDLDDFQMERSWKDTTVYCNSKLMNIQLANEIARRCEGTGLVANSNHPGVVMTEIFRNLPGWFRVPLHGMIKVFYKTPKEGAQTTIYQAVSPDFDNVSGEYYVDCKKGTMSPEAKDVEFAKKVWEKCEEAVKLQPDEKHY